jgi:hypothetical protein
MTSVIKVLGFFSFGFWITNATLRIFLPARSMLRSTAQRTTRLNANTNAEDYEGRPYRHRGGLLSDKTGR